MLQLRPSCECCDKALPSLSGLRGTTRACSVAEPSRTRIEGMAKARSCERLSLNRAGRGTNFTDLR